MTATLTNIFNGTGAIWNYDQLITWAEQGGIDPLDPAMIQPASVDLKLGREVKRANRNWQGQIMLADMRDMGTIETLVDRVDGLLERPVEAMAEFERLKQEYGGQWENAEDFDYYLLMPGESVLCSSAERVQIPPQCSSMLTLKSSYGRQAIGIAHMGFGEAGFGLGDPAQWTFCLTNHGVMPFLLEAGRPIVQMIIVSMLPGTMSYATRAGGNYQGQEGPTESRVPVGTYTG